MKTPPQPLAQASSDECHMGIMRPSGHRFPLPHHPPALSLIFVLFLMTMVIVAASGISASIVSSIQQTKDLFLSEQAYYASRATLEKALAAAADQGIGYEGSDSAAITWDLDGVTTTDEVTGTYDIFARAKPIDWDASTWDFTSATPCTGTDPCYVPIPGTGDADTDCDFEDIGQSWYDEADDDCNWNRIAYGETVSIPFFYDDSAYSDGVADPSDTLLSIFTLKVRTPIDASTGSGATLQTSDGNDVVLNWQFVGECDEDGDGILESCYLTAVIDGTPAGPFTPGIDESLIEESDVNNATSIDYEVLDESSYGENQRGYQWEIGSDFFTDSTLYRMYLQLSVISPLVEESTTDQVPYLEYQIVVDQEISDNKIIYAAEAGVQGKLGVYVRNLQGSQSIENSAVVNFVIQN